MPRHSLYGALFVLSVATVPAYGQVKLEWKFKEGEQFTLEAVMSSKEKSFFLGKEQKQDLTLTFVFGYKVVRKFSDVTVLEQKIESIKAEGSGDLEPLNNLLNEFKGAKLKVTLNSKSQFQRMDGYLAVISEIAKDQAAAPMIKELFPEENLKTLVNETFGALPEKAITPNFKWGGKFSVPLGSFGTLTGTTDYTYVGPVDDKEKITVEARVTGYTPPKRGSDVAPAKEAPPKAENVKGVIFFDRTAGKLASSEMSMTIKGTFRVAGPMGQETTVEMSQDRSIRLKMVKK